MQIHHVATDACTSSLSPLVRKMPLLLLFPPAVLPFNPLSAMLPSVITHLQRRKEYPARSEAASFPAPSCFRAVSRRFSETNRVFWKKPGRTLGRAVSCVFSFRNTWSCELDLRVLPALFSYLLSAAVNQVSRRRVSRVLPLLRTGRRARLSTEGSTNYTQVLHVDWTIYLIFTFSKFSLWIYL